MYRILVTVIAVLLVAVAYNLPKSPKTTDIDIIKDVCGGAGDLAAIEKCRRCPYGVAKLEGC